MIFAIPLYDDNPIARTPVVTYLLIGMCTGAFLWELGQNQHAVTFGYGMIPAVLFGFAHLSPRLATVPPWATVLTSMFLHGGWMHLIGNMLFLWLFGNNIEDVLGRGRFLFLYLFCGIVAALVQALSSPYSHVPMVGASGAIAGVLGAYLLLYPKANVHTFVWIIIFFRVINVPAWILLGCWFGLQFVSGLASGAGSPGVAFWAHVGGFVSGVVLIALLRPGGTALFQPPRSRVFASAPPSILVPRRSYGSSSVPSAGRTYFRPRRPWD